MIKRRLSGLSSFLGVGALGLLASSGCSEEPCKDVSGHACVWAGTGELSFNGDGHHRLDTSFYWVADMEFAPDGTPWVLDWNNHTIRRLLPDETFDTVVGDLFVGDGPPDLSDLTPEGAPGDLVSLNHPTEIEFLPDGNMLFMSWHNHKLRHLSVADERVTVMCGRGFGFKGDGGPAAQALFNQPKALELTPEGGIYILDQRNHRIRYIAPGPDAIVTTVVGTGVPGYSGDGGSPLEAQLEFEAGGNPEPSGALALGSDGVLYISDGLNHRIRKVDFEANTIETIAGTGEPGYSGDGGPAIDAQINNVRDLEFGPDGRLYMADSDNNRIRAIDLETGIIELVAGSGEVGTAADKLPAEEIELNRPFGIVFDRDGNLYISDTYNSRIIKVAR